jgi:hypothetical protein
VLPSVVNAMLLAAPRPDGRSRLTSPTLAGADDEELANADGDDVGKLEVDDSRLDVEAGEEAASGEDNAAVDSRGVAVEEGWEDWKVGAVAEELSTAVLPVAEGGEEEAAAVLTGPLMERDTDEELGTV